MHELSVAESILDIVKENTSDVLPSKVKRVKVRLGELAGVVADSLEFSFTAITAGTSLEKCSLEVEKVGIVVKCGDCGLESPLERFAFKCPTCGGDHVEVISGDDLQVVEREIADEG